MGTNRRPRLAMLAAAAALVLAGSACGSDSDGATDSDPADASTSPVEGEAPATRDDGATETSDNPIVLGFEISGPEGTVVEISAVFDVVGGDQQEMDQTITLRDEPSWQLYTPFIERAALTLEVTEGGPATIDGFRGNSADVENPFAGYVVAEQLGTAELLSGEITTFDLP